MLEVVADAFVDEMDLATRRERFTCSDFTYQIALNGMSGIVVLEPEKRTLMVSNAAVGYVQVRIMDSEGTPIGAMILNSDGRVIWSMPDLS